MNLKTFGKKVGKDIAENLPKILVCGSIAGMVTSVVFAVKATPKAMILLDEKKQELGTEKLDVKTIVKTAAPAYIPTAISMVASAGCMIGAMNENDRRNAALAAAYSLSESALKQYCPTYSDGTQLALVRFPHAGTFEIPIVTVNNKNLSGRRNLGNVQDAIGINAKVAERLSGADFDGDTVVAIPRSSKVDIKSTPALKDLKDFDPKTAYCKREYKG